MPNIQLAYGHTHDIGYYGLTLCRRACFFSRILRCMRIYLPMGLSSIFNPRSHFATADWFAGAKTTLSRRLLTHFTPSSMRSRRGLTIATILLFGLCFRELDGFFKDFLRPIVLGKMISGNAMLPCTHSTQLPNRNRASSQTLSAYTRVLRYCDGARIWNVMSSGRSEFLDLGALEEMEDDIMGTRNGARLTCV